MNDGLKEKRTGDEPAKREKFSSAAVWMRRIVRLKNEIEPRANREKRMRDGSHRPRHRYTPRVVAGTEKRKSAAGHRPRKIPG